MKLIEHWAAAMPFTSRRARRAAAVTAALAGASPESRGEQRPISVGKGAATAILLPTTCERPLLIETAVALAVASGQHCLIVRLNTAPNPPCFVSFDVVLWAEAGLEIAVSLAPCVGDGVLWLVPDDRSGPLLQLSRTGLRMCVLSHRFVASGIAAAAALYRRNLWGGLTHD